MKRLWVCGLLWSVFLIGHSVTQAETMQPGATAQAKAVVQAYLGALLQGDLESVRQVLGGDMLKKSEMLQSDAGYSAKLNEIYSGTSYEITNLKAIRNSKVAVDVTLDMGLSNSMDTRFIVSKITDPSTQQEKYLITDETSQGL